MQKRALGKLGCEKGEGGARRINFKKKPMIQKARCNRDVTEVRERFWRIFFLQLVWYIVRSPIVEYCN
jgi:hypothetical protein